MIAATGPSGALRPISSISASEANRMVEMVMPLISTGRRGSPGPQRTRRFLRFGRTSARGS
jgi:hypothetical protein